MGNEQSSEADSRKTKRKQNRPTSDQTSTDEFKGIPLDTKVPKLSDEQLKQREKMIEKYKRRKAREERRQKREEERLRIEKEARKSNRTSNNHNNNTNSNSIGAAYPPIEEDTLSTSTCTTVKTNTVTIASSRIVYGHGDYIEEDDNGHNITNSERLGFQIVASSRSMSGLSLYSGHNGYAASTTGHPHPVNERKARRRRVREHQEQQEGELLDQWDISSDISDSVSQTNSSQQPHPHRHREGGRLRRRQLL
ncbi:hypothetical protein ADEAN_000113300 [Angomonas deanei]|uniref:Uncharacterized protein n=1 Tax=Angomonas deanei TaxID=59799 RepID=A0A7G2C1T8_9TRYP|nr:hypothetical protein ADEAN_000113300 [Angomonas deanei]